MNQASFFHPGERAMQTRAGVEEVATSRAGLMIKDHLTAQHQAFFPLLNTLFVGSVDVQGRVWASVLVAPPGFIQVVDERHLRIKARPVDGDPLGENLTIKQYLGFLGLEFSTRRRNRMTGQVMAVQDAAVDIEVTQALGNCPKYIQARRARFLETGDASTRKAQVHRVEVLSDEIKRWIAAADTFFIASYYPQADYLGADVSHRGGMPGFVRIEDDTTLCFDDFSGNNLYMTLGNLLSNPVAGLLFIDFDTGDILQLSCRSEIIETPGEQYARQIRLHLDYGWLIKAALPIEWVFIEASPFLK